AADKGPICSVGALSRTPARKWARHPLRLESRRVIYTLAYIHVLNPRGELRRPRPASVIVQASGARLVELYRSGYPVVLWARGERSPRQNGEVSFFRGVALPRICCEICCEAGVLWNWKLGERKREP